MAKNDDRTFSITELQTWLNDREHEIGTHLGQSADSASDTAPGVIAFYSTLFWTASVVFLYQAALILLDRLTLVQLFADRARDVVGNVANYFTPVVQACLLIAALIALSKSPWKAWIGQSLGRFSPVAALRLVLSPRTWSDVIRMSRREFIGAHRFSILVVVCFVIEILLFFVLYFKLFASVPTSPEHVPEVLVRLALLLASLATAWAIVGTLFTFTSIRDRSAVTGITTGCILVFVDIVLVGHWLPYETSPKAVVYAGPDIRSPVLFHSDEGTRVWKSKEFPGFFRLPAEDELSEDGWVQAACVKRVSKSSVIGADSASAKGALPFSQTKWWIAFLLGFYSGRLICLSFGTFGSTMTYLIDLAEFDLEERKEKTLFHARLPDKRETALPPYAFRILPGQKKIAVLRRDKGVGYYRFHDVRDRVFPTLHTYVILNLSGIVAQDALDMTITTPDNAFDLDVDMRIRAVAPDERAVSFRQVCLHDAPTNWFISEFFHNNPGQGYIQTLRPAMNRILSRIYKDRQLRGLHHLITQCRDLATYVERNEQALDIFGTRNLDSYAQEGKTAKTNAEERLREIESTYNRLVDFFGSPSLSEVMHDQQRFILQEAMSKVYSDPELTVYEETIETLWSMLGIEVSDITLKKNEAEHQRYDDALAESRAAVNGLLQKMEKTTDILARLTQVIPRRELLDLLKRLGEKPVNDREKWDELNRRIEDAEEKLDYEGGNERGGEDACEGEGEGEDKGEDKGEEDGRDI